MTPEKGKLYIVATPIGNLDDLSCRAVYVLKNVDLIAAEDTRQTRRLLERYAIHSPLISVHEHNEQRKAQGLVERIADGSSVALVSDAGTPLINDPGFELLSLAIESSVTIVPVPGASALISALSVSGLATDRFSFYGFPPRTQSARTTFFESLVRECSTLIFYESCHRIVDCLSDCAEIFPSDRKLVIAREMTKSHETIVRTDVGHALSLVQKDSNMQRGEIVLLIQGASAKAQANTLLPEHIGMLKIVLQECSVKKAAELVSQITGLRRKLLYSAALDIENGRL